MNKHRKQRGARARLDPRGTILGAVALLSVSACRQPERPPGEVVYESDRVRLYAEASVSYCGGTADYLERHLDQVESRYGLSPPQIVEYYLLGDLDDWCEQVPDSTACGGSGLVYATAAPSTHELSHAIRATPSRAVVTEGWAELMDNGMPPYSASEAIPDAVRVDGPDLPFELYASAGAFMQYVELDFGADAVRRLLDETDGEMTFAEFETVFAEITGVALDMYAAVAQSVPCDSRGASWVLATCSRQDGLAIAEQPLDWDLDASCSSADAYGPWRGEYWVEQVLDVDADGTRVDIAIDLPAEATTTLERCASCEDFVGHEFGENELTNRTLQAGRWYLRVRAPLGTPLAGRIEVRVSP